MARGGKRPGAGAPKLPEAEKAKRISITLSPVTLTKLDTEAKRSGKARSRVVEQALEAHLGKD